MSVSVPRAEALTPAEPSDRDGAIPPLESGDRLVLYGDIGKDAVIFVYRVRATNAGVFQAPGAFAEALYDPKTNGLSPSAKLEVVKP